MFEGTFVGAAKKWEGEQYASIVGEDFHDHFLLYVQFENTNKPTFNLEGDAEFSIHTTPSSIAIAGASNPEYSYYWEAIEEMCSDLWKIKSALNESNQILNPDEFWSGESSAEVKEYQLGDYKASATSSNQLLSLEGPGWGLTQSEISAQDFPIRDSYPEQKIFENRGGLVSWNVSESTSAPAQEYVETQEDPWVDEENYIEYNNPDFIIQNYHPEIAWVAERDYQIVSPDNLQAVVEEIMAHDGVIAFDTETTGLDINFQSMSGNGDDVVGLVISIREGQAWYFPLRHNRIENVCPPDQIAFFMKTYLEPILQKPTIMFNASFDLKVLYLYQIIPNLECDVMAFYKLTRNYEEGGVPDPETGRPSASLKNLTYHYLNRKAFELEMFLPGYEGTSKKNAWGKADANFADLPYESTRLYACADTDNTLALYNLFLAEGFLEQYGAANILNLENKFAYVVAYSEFFGAHVSDDLEPLTQEIEDAIQAPLEALREMSGDDSFNPNSSKQVGYLMEQFEVPVIEYTSTGNASWNANVLKKLSGETRADGSPKFPVVNTLIDYKEIAKVRSSFLNPIKKNQSNGFIFPSIDPFLATGRSSTSKPNIQSIPSFVKKYVKPREGYYTANFDYSSVEYRILACMSHETELIEFFMDPIKDYHRRQASLLFDTPYAKVTSKMRKLAKPINFGIPYGMSNASLGGNVFGDITPENTEKAAKLRAKYFEHQPHVEQFFIDAAEHALEHGWVQTHYGRRRYFDPYQLGDGDYDRGVGKVTRQAGNHPIQGTAADTFKIACIQLFNKIVQEGYWGKILITAMVHDEVNLEIHGSIEPREVVRLLKENVELQIEGWCPLYIEMGFGDSWGQAKDQGLNAGVQAMLLDRQYNWSGDIQDWYKFTEGVRSEYHAQTVYQYLSDSSNYGQDFDPDVEEFLTAALRSYSVEVSSDLHENILSFAKIVEDNKGSLPFSIADIEELFPSREEESSAELSNEVPKGSTDQYPTDLTDWDQAFQATLRQGTIVYQDKYNTGNQYLLVLQSPEAEEYLNDNWVEPGKPNETMEVVYVGDGFANATGKHIPLAFIDPFRGLIGY